MKTSSAIITCAALCAAALGCGADAAAPGGATSYGVLAIPLATQVNGVHYRLSGDTFVMTGAGVTSTLQHDGAGAVVYAVAPPGSYSVELLDGWALERFVETAFQAVEAALVSPNPRAVEIVSGQSTIAAWVFQTDGVAISLAPGTFQGNLAVVDSSNPAASILGDVAATEQSHVDALSGVGAVAGSLSIGAGVASLAALSALTRVDGDLSISGSALTALAGLEQLGHVGGELRITGNAALPTCEAEWLASNIAALGGELGVLEIAGNDDAAACP